MVICINSYQHSDLLLIKARPKGVKANYNEHEEGEDKDR